MNRRIQASSLRKEQGKPFINDYHNRHQSPALVEMSVMHYEVVIAREEGCDFFFKEISDSNKRMGRNYLG